MEKKMEISGMMCMHCSARVKKALESIDGVASAEVSHESGSAAVRLLETVSDEVLKKTVENSGYKVTAII